MGKDVEVQEEALEFPVDAAGCRQEVRKECFVYVRDQIILTILVHFGASGVVQEQVGIIIAELPIASKIIAPAGPREVVNEAPRIH